MKQINNDVFRVRSEKHAMSETLRYTLSNVDKILSEELIFCALIRRKILQDCRISPCVMSHIQKQEKQRLL